MIFGPMFHVGWASASSGVTSASSSRRAAAERPTGSRQHQRVDGLGVAALEALERRRVLESTGSSKSSTPLLRGECELARGDEALLVREREIDARLERPQCCRQAREADDGVQDDVRLGALEQLA